MQRCHLFAAVCLFLCLTCSWTLGAPFIRWIIGNQRLYLPLPPSPGPSSLVGMCTERAAHPPWSLPQSLVAHRVPLKPYAAPVPRSQSLQDQPTRNLAAFPASHDPDPAVPTPTATPSARGAVIRQNSDPTSEGPGPSPNPPAWVRPDNEAPPKVRIALRTRKEQRNTVDS